MKNDLLAEAGTTQFPDKRALGMAAESLNAPEIAERRSVLSRRIAMVRKTFHYLRYLVFAAVGIAFFVAAQRGGLQRHSADPADWGLLGIASICMAMFSMLPLAALQAAVHHLWANKSDNELLQPLAGTIQCEYSLRDLENGGARVSQWRDLALSERGQLHGFDGHIMAALHGVHRDQKARDIRQAEVDTACRKLHGLEPLVPQ